MVNSYFAQNVDLLGWRDIVNTQGIPGWKPVPLTHASWPPDYKSVYAWRLQTLAKLRKSPQLLTAAKAYYASRPAEFIMHWMDTYDPRRHGSKWIPFVLFTRQAEFIQFLQECIRDDESGLVEKCRDAGVTWLACAYSVHQWIFVKEDAIGWGSRKQELVDKKGDVSSIFEKLRMLVRRLPNIWRPDGLSERDHMSFMKLLNPANGAVIAGETGDNIGRGGRTRAYIVDESAHLERPELIEAALGDNTNVQIDISSVNGLGNVFHRKAEAAIVWRPGAYDLKPGMRRKFIFDWTEHPAKTQQWYDQRKAKAEREGMQHVFAQEVDRNYSAAISNTVVPYEWIAKCVDAHKSIHWVDDRGTNRVGFTNKDIPNNWIAGLDIADEGIDRNALGLRQWIIWRDVEEWGERDPGVSARRAMQRCKQIRGIKCQYDSIGIGSNVKSEYNRLVDEGIIIPADMPFVPWNAGASVQQPYNHVIPDDDESLTNKDFFHNMKAQAWWSLRTRFYKTFKNLTAGEIYPIDDLISLDSRMPLLQQVMKELAQPTRVTSSSLRMMIDKKPDGTKSPNLADAGVMMFFPVDDTLGQLQTSTYGF